MTRPPDSSYWVILKPGLLATDAGASVTVAFDSTSSDPPIVTIEFLRSWHHMGKAQFVCRAGCACTPAIVEANFPLRKYTEAEPFTLSNLSLTEPRGHPCEIKVTVLNETSSGEYRFALMTLAVTT